VFNITEIKNANRTRISDKKQPIPLEELFEAWPEEQKPMPYFSVVPEQVRKDQRFKVLSEVEQGRFLRLCIEIAGPGERGRFANHDGIMAKRLDLDVEVWKELQEKLLSLDLLKLSADGYHLIQPELREQCLQYARQKPLNRK
jgi:hypothetical protein